jgi:hypothetical protein
MKKLCLMAAVVLMFAATVFAQSGAVSVMVSSQDNRPVGRAMVTLAGIDGGHHGTHAFFTAFTDPTGGADFPSVPVGPYTVTAGAMMHGMASTTLEVMARQTTNVTLTLNMPGDSSNMNPGDSTHHHQGHGDSLAIVNLEGTAIVVAADTVLHRMARYGLDVDGDGTVDYVLSFGTPWYRPPSAAHRPNSGDHITISGGMFTYTQPPMVVVYSINGLAWRRPGEGHGGFAGGDHQGRGCNLDSVTRVELNGTAIVRSMGMWHGEMHMYAISTNGDTLPDYVLDFGAPEYHPDNGAQRPADGDTISIVGGQIYCADASVQLPVVIVYEINGLLWRQPGDTLGLGPDMTTSVSGPVATGEPVSYLTARNFPNPFNPTTTIGYSIPTAGNVHVSVFDITGREVAILVNGYQTAGQYAVQWDGHSFASGIYFYRVTVGNLSFTNRMVLMK